jgi:mRNA-degrading endonuclease toxin of MazEF toxin-antitoxin module
MKRGTVLWVNLSDAHPPELGKVCPGVVFSNSTLNARLDTLLIVPLSTQPGEIWPLRVKVAAGNRKPSFAILPGLRQVAKARLLEKIAVLSAADLGRVDAAAAEYLSD